MPEYAPFPINPQLTGVALAYKNAKMIADDIAPRKPVGGETFKFHKHELADKITVPDTLVGRKSEPNQVEFGTVEVDSSTEDYGLDDLVPNKDIDNARNIPGFDPLATATENLSDIIELAREIRTANIVFNADSYGDDNKLTLAGTDQWSDYDNSDPVDQIKEALDGCVVRPNVAVFGRAGYSKLSSHPKILKSVYKQNVDAGIAARSAIAELFELDEILVGDAWVNIARPGKPIVRSRAWGKHCALIVRDKLADFQNKRPTFCLTAQWGARIAGELPEPKKGLRGSVLVRVGESVRELVIADDLGFLLENVVA